MKAKELFLEYFENYPFEDFSPESEMTKELWSVFDKELEEEVHSYCVSKKLFDYDVKVITEGISDKAYTGDFWSVEDYISQFYEAEYLVECAEQRAYERMVAVESRYW